MLQTIISHRSDGQPLSVEAGIVRVADALDMAKGRSRIPFEAGRVSIHSLSAAAIEAVRIRRDPGKVMIEIEMNNSAGLYQVDNLLSRSCADRASRSTSTSGDDRGRHREAPAAVVSAVDGLQSGGRRPNTPLVSFAGLCGVV